MNFCLTWLLCLCEVSGAGLGCPILRCCQLIQLQGNYKHKHRYILRYTDTDTNMCTCRIHCLLWVKKAAHGTYAPYTALSAYIARQSQTQIWLQIQMQTQWQLQIQTQTRNKYTCPILCVQWVARQWPILQHYQLIQAGNQKFKYIIQDQIRLSLCSDF